MKKVLVALLIAVLAIGTIAGCGKKEEGGNEAGGETASYTIAVPNDTTNEARALLLLEANGYLKLKEGAGITATVQDIEENPYNLKFTEVEAAQVPRTLQDVDFAIINSNYAIDAGMNPVKESLVIEGSASAYANIISVKEGNEEDPLVKALVAAITSEKVKNYIDEKYEGSVVSAVDAPTDGFDSELDYEALKGQTIKVAASPAPHAELLAIAKEILAEKEITLEITEYNDYVLPNNVVEEGEFLANFFQHVPYMDDFNANNGTHIVSVASVHVEPMGLYGGKQSSLDVLKK